MLGSGTKSFPRYACQHGYRERCGTEVWHGYWDQSGMSVLCGFAHGVKPQSKNVCCLACPLSVHTPSLSSVPLILLLHLDAFKKVQSRLSFPQVPLLAQSVDFAGTHPPALSFHNHGSEIVEISYVTISDCRWLEYHHLRL
jgi:hypothetical protein